MFEHRQLRGGDERPPRTTTAALPRWGPGPWLLASSLILAIGIASPFALATGEGRPVEAGDRNPDRGSLTRETQIISGNGTYSTRQSNKGAGGGAIYGCRSAAGAEACIRTRNLNTGRAFQFEADKASEVGLIQTGTNPTAVNGSVPPFLTNAGGRVANLNADRVDGAEAEDLLTRTAVVASDGSRVRGRGSTGSRRLGAGNYEVSFDRDVSGCAYLATVGSTADRAPGDGDATVSSQTGNANAVQVNTRIDGQGAADPRADRSFHLAVTC